MKSRTVAAAVMLAIAVLTTSFSSCMTKPDAAANKSASNSNSESANTASARALSIYEEFRKVKLTKGTAPQVEQAFTTAMNALDELLKTSGDDAKAVDDIYAYKAAASQYMYSQVAGDDQSKVEQYKQYRLKAIEDWAARPTSSNKVKASAYYTLGKNHWDEAYILTRTYENLAGCPNLLKDFDYPDKCFNVKPIPPDVAAKIREHASQAKAYFTKAIAVMPEWSVAHSMLKLTLRQEIYVTPDQAARSGLIALYKDEGIKANQFKDSEQSLAMQRE